VAHVQKLPAGTDSQPGLEQSQLRRADALAAHLRQLSGAGLRGGQHRLDLVQPRPVLAGHEDALAGCVIRDACTREASLTWQPCDLSKQFVCAPTRPPVLQHASDLCRICHAHKFMHS